MPVSGKNGELEVISLMQKNKLDGHQDKDMTGEMFRGTSDFVKAMSLIHSRIPKDTREKKDILINFDADDMAVISGLSGATKMASPFAEMLLSAIRDIVRSGPSNGRSILVMNRFEVLTVFGYMGYKPELILRIFKSLEKYEEQLKYNPRKILEGLVEE